MRILLAAPDRDLLLCYQKLLEDAFGETVTAFDGTNVIALLRESAFDLVILDRELPRIGYRQIVRLLNEKEIPVIVLTDSAVSAGLLSEDGLANEYMAYPFAPGDMLETIRNVMEKAASDQALSVGSLLIEVPKFRIGGGRVTASEIDALRKLLRGEAIDFSAGAWISALNKKFAAAGSGARIHYISKEGFRLVMNDE